MWGPIKDNPVVSSTGDGSVRIKFKCRSCGHDVITDVINIPEPNTMADNAEDSIVYETENVVCPIPTCSEDYEVNISNSTGGMSVNIDDVNENNIYYESVN
jgi:hypothetical protein